MRNKPMIGLNADFRAAKKDSPAFTFISAGYYDAIAAVGGIPVVLPPLANEEDLSAYSACWTAWCWSAEPILIRAATGSCCIRRSGRWSRGAKISIGC